MEENKFSGILSVAGVIGCLAFFFGFRNTFPKLATFLLICAVVFCAIVGIVVVLVIYMALKKSPEKEGDQTHQELVSLQKEGRASLIELRKIGMNIKNQAIRQENEKICELANKIIGELKNHKKSVSGVRGFFHYYLPTLGKILKNYRKLEEGGVVEEDVTCNTLKCLTDIKTAMEKQYQNLFEKYVLDMTVEMEALMMACKRDGLILEEEEADDKIKLMF